MNNNKLQIQGGAMGAASFAAILQLIAQPHPLSCPMLFAVFAFAVALPSNVVLFLVPDLTEYRKPGRQQPVLIALYYYLQTTARLGFLLATAALLWSVCVSAAVLFLGIALPALAYLLVVTTDMKRNPKHYEKTRPVA